MSALHEDVNVNSTRPGDVRSNCLPRQGRKVAPERDCSIKVSLLLCLPISSGGDSLQGGARP
jgi:hypothetical protein